MGGKGGTAKNRVGWIDSAAGDAGVPGQWNELPGGIGWAQAQRGAKMDPSGWGMVGPGGGAGPGQTMSSVEE